LQGQVALDVLQLLGQRGLGDRAQRVPGELSEDDQQITGPRRVGADQADDRADRVEEVITNKLYPEVEDEEEIDEPVEEETNLEDDDEYQLIDDVIPVEPQQVETIQIVEEVKEPEFQVPSEFTEHFKSLEEMGFKDKELNFRLLKVHKGDLVKVVSALLSLPL